MDIKKEKRIYFIRVAPENEVKSRAVPKVGPFAWYEIMGVSLNAAKDEFVRQFRNSKYRGAIKVTNKNLISANRRPLFAKPQRFEDIHL